MRARAGFTLSLLDRISALKKRLLRAPMSLPPHKDTAKCGPSGNQNRAPTTPLITFTLIWACRLQNQENKSLQLTSCPCSAVTCGSSLSRRLPSPRACPVPSWLSSVCPRRMSVGWSGKPPASMGNGRASFPKGLPEADRQGSPQGPLTVHHSALPTTMGRPWPGLGLVLSLKEVGHKSLEFQNRSLRRKLGGRQGELGHSRVTLLTGTQEASPEWHEDDCPEVAASCCLHKGLTQRSSACSSLCSPGRPATQGPAQPQLASTTSVSGTRAPVPLQCYQFPELEALGVFFGGPGPGQARWHGGPGLPLRVPLLSSWPGAIITVGGQLAVGFLASPGRCWPVVWASSSLTPGSGSSSPDSGFSLKLPRPCSSSCLWPAVFPSEGKGQELGAASSVQRLM